MEGLGLAGPWPGPKDQLCEPQEPPAKAFNNSPKMETCQGSDIRTSPVSTQSVDRIAGQRIC